ncbi:hypothetical protein [Gordonia sp. (in: high G+C Gram-positive bacteria)]|uniref:hypothetical protein n=1 Tax=Gordonia sp. (in: high G+C Gram-positive bacteria) TaxID=84139 RepID=UPI0039E40E32
MAAFDDDELERYYRRIEARTEAGPGPAKQRRDPVADDGDVLDCPTPGKTGHPGEDAAWLAVAVIRAGRLHTPDLDVYRCRCGLWHITSGDRG